MTWQDLLNAIFELGGGVILWINVYRLIKDKSIKGVSIISFAFFAFWGYWNLYYYPHLNQILSFLGGLIVVSANTTWVILAVYYTRKRKDK